MKKYTYIIVALLIWSCDDPIDVDLVDKDPLVVIDAFIDNTTNEQKIVVSQTQPYFNETTIVGVEDATVSVTYGNPSQTVNFILDENGIYTYPNGFGEVGDDFSLNVIVDGITYSAVSRMNRVPELDSVTFRREEVDFFGLNEIFFVGEFWSRDPEGPGDTYWIKAYKNGEFLSKPEEMNLAYDAGFSAGGNVDNSIFIQPIRDGVNPFDENDDGDIISPYEDGDSLYVEIHAISNDAYTFLQNVLVQTDVPSGFGALFATPQANVRGNIVSSDPNISAVGFFSTAAVSAGGKTLDISEVPIEE